MSNVKLHKPGSNIANHGWSNNHRINFEESKIVDQGNYRSRKSLKSWHTANTVYSDNNSFERFLYQNPIIFLSVNN